jgi:coenzyme F420 biosynthesis associated uncharacterized protein
MSAYENAEASKSPFRDRRVVAVGAVAGAALGAWAGQRMRSFAQQDRPQGMIDWERARATALNMNRGHTLTAVERDRLDQYYGGLVERCVPIVSNYTESHLPASEQRTFAFDRVDWINANLDGFKRMFAPIEEMDTSRPGANVATRLWGGLNQSVLSYEVGLLLGYLARRVLGQYDLALLGREPVGAGKLYYVEPNIRFLEQTLKLPKDDFRMWLALHETTHAFEFEAHPWVRIHFNSLLETYMEFMKQDVEYLKQGVRGLKTIAGRARTKRSADSSWLEAVMTDEQRSLFQQMQAMMCVIEGYSNHVMNAVGKRLLPTYELISKRFEERQQQRSPAEQLFARLTGLDVKMEQYRAGERFIDEVVKERSHEMARRVWDAPEYLPTMDEIRHPAKWIARVDAMVPAAG